MVFLYDLPLFSLICKERRFDITFQLDGGVDIRVLTDNPDYGQYLIGSGIKLRKRETPAEEEYQQIAGVTTDNPLQYEGVFNFPGPWDLIIVTEQSVRSQYDALIQYGRRYSTQGAKENLICIAGSGTPCHGQKGRIWHALPGNLQLSIFLKPGKVFVHSAAAMMILPAVAVAEAIEKYCQTTVDIKWVNDIVVHNEKVAGVVAHTHTKKEKLVWSAIGIGVNIQSAPQDLNSEFIKRATCLRDLNECEHSVRTDQALRCILHVFKEKYNFLLGGRFAELFDEYIKRSYLIGKKVVICLDEDCTQKVTGRIQDIGDNLELYLDKYSKPLFKGRVKSVL